MRLYVSAFVFGFIGAAWQAIHAEPRVPVAANVAAVIVATVFTGVTMSALRNAVRRFTARHCVEPLTAIRRHSSLVRKFNASLCAAGLIFHGNRE